MTTVDKTNSSTPLPPANSQTSKANNAPQADNAPAASTTSANTNTSTGTSKTSSAVISISTISSQLQAAQAASSSDSVFSTNKVAEIKAAITAGHFKVDSSRVADGLLQSVRGLLHSGKQSSN